MIDWESFDKMEPVGEKEVLVCIADGHDIEYKIVPIEVAWGAAHKFTHWAYLEPPHEDP